MDASDGEIVERVRGGDVEAYRFLVARHFSPFLRYATRMLGNRADAEEAVQDTFARAYRSLHRCDTSRPVDSWLWRILVNRCRTIGAQRRTREKLLERVGEQATDMDLHASTWSATPGDPRPELQRALERMPTSHREALLLKYLDDRTYEEMTVLTGVSVSALKMRVKRARTMLEAMLREVYDD